MDANDQLSAGLVQLIVDPALSLNNPNDENHTAGVTFVGQFLEHDMTFDTTSRLGRPANSRRRANARHPFLDLDSVYGDGPSGSPQFYDAADSATVRVESGGLHEDVPRDETPRAIVADTRNDETVAVAGLQAACLLFDNHVVDPLRLEGPSIDDEEAFTRARQQTTWHSSGKWCSRSCRSSSARRWSRVPSPAGRAAAGRAKAANSSRSSRWPTGSATCARRTGELHRRRRPAVLRHELRHRSGPGLRPVGCAWWGPGLTAVRGVVHLLPLPRTRGRHAPQQAHRHQAVDAAPQQCAIASGQPPTSLAQRNLLRHLTWSLPSGQAIARAMGAAVVRPPRLSELAAIHPPFVRSTPTWYYVLREADIFGAGRAPGARGRSHRGRGVPGTAAGRPRLDAARGRGFQPTLGSTSGDFRMWTS